jgi:hypothetical protein
MITLSNLKKTRIIEMGFKYFFKIFITCNIVVLYKKINIERIRVVSKRFRVGVYCSSLGKFLKLGNVHSKSNDGNEQ